MHRRQLVISGALLASLAACASTPLRVDVAREAEALLRTDTEWSAAINSGQSADSIAGYWTDDARVAMPGQATVAGKAGLLDMVKGSMAIPGFRISWKPDSAVVSQSGDMGYTYGSNSMTMPDAKGKPATETGRYIAVWRKSADGRWRCVMDYGTNGPVGTGAPGLVTISKTTASAMPVLIAGSATISAVGLGRGAG